MTAKKSTRKATAAKSSAGFSAEERAAMKEHAQEIKAEARRGSRASKADGEATLLAKVAEMEGTDRELAQRLHEIVTAEAPELTPKTWYGMPAYARDGKVVFFFQSAGKFKSRYATLGFNDPANLDDGDMWPTTYALKAMTPAVEKRIVALVRQAVS
ncbi:uncharacterized protein YdhG (YjbR/CyaY superfamily) [Stackebrandtia albiflava]|uniref:Uncharacterized protein YdhG (YjbR/CyaY superfamily) n=1 Tax=Stackebrandtia albiflava TaxID=406432 RepID=A0A562VES9_9ACTN|nr:DUF1801 domain-containing protein [Stackebrandtia albiflava]TWJ16327.1 uncharacterized protein YdhG (YjbR/CyaY superfamily) [Stackebrandtia albiflava]